MPFNADLMKRYEVSSHANFVKNDPACAESVAKADAAGA